MWDSLCIPNLWKTLNINYWPWNFILSTNNISEIKRGDTLPQNNIQRRVSAGNKRMETKIQKNNPNDG